MNKKTSMLLAFLLTGITAMADIAVYQESFTNFVQGTDYFYNPSFASGYDPAGATAGLNSGEWGSTSASTYTNGTLKINSSGVTAAKIAGTFVDASVFTQGSGIYTLNFDIIGDLPSGNKNMFAWITTASGVTTDGTNDFLLATTGVNLGNGNPFSGSGAASLTTVKSANYDSTITATGVTLDFTYTVGDIVGIAFGSVNTDAAIDNVSITTIPEPATMGLVVAFGGTILFIRRRFMI